MTTDPYAAIAEIYDLEFSGVSADVPGYDRRRTGPRVLVVGCGTGRVCRGLTAAEIVGLDRSEPMLNVARARATRAEAYVCGDMTRFALGTYNDIIIPNAAFAFLPDRAARAACLAACRAALAPGGALTIDLPMPEHRLWGTRHHPEQPAWEGEVAGRRVWRTRETFRDPVRQDLRLVDRYRDDAGWTATSELCLHLFSVDEVHWMLEANGFYADQVWGDYDEGALQPGCPRLLARALPL